MKVYERGKGPTYFPVLVYSSADGKKTYSCACEALIATLGKDEKATMPTAGSRIDRLKDQMKQRQAPITQIKQLDDVRKRYEEKVQECKSQ